MGLLVGLGHEDFRLYVITCNSASSACENGDPQHVLGELGGIRMLDIVFCKDFLCIVFRHIRIFCMPDSDFGT